jgi:translation initiation factor 1A
MSKRGGKKSKRSKNNKPNGETNTRSLLEAEDEGQEYAVVIKMLGNGRLMAYCYSDSKQRLCHIRGKLKKKVWINQGDTVLLSMREFEDDKSDV